MEMTMPLKHKKEWKDVAPIDANQVFEMKYDRVHGHCWPDPLVYKDVRGRHKVTRILIEIEVEEEEN